MPVVANETQGSPGSSMVIRNRCRPAALPPERRAKALRSTRRSGYARQSEREALPQLERRDRGHRALPALQPEHSRSVACVHGRRGGLHRRAAGPRGLAAWQEQAEHWAWRRPGPSTPSRRYRAIARRSLARQTTPERLRSTRSSMDLIRRWRVHRAWHWLPARRPSPVQCRRSTRQRQARAAASEG